MINLFLTSATLSRALQDFYYKLLFYSNICRGGKFFPSKLV